MLTRVRIEASAETAAIVKDELLMGMVTIRDYAGGEWEHGEGDMEIVSSDKGFWGRLTIRRARNDKGELTTGGSRDEEPRVE